MLWLISLLQGCTLEELRLRRRGNAAEGSMCCISDGLQLRIYISACYALSRFSHVAPDLSSL